MKTLAELRIEVDLGLYVYRIGLECYVQHDSWGYWFGGPGADNLYPSFEALCEEVEGVDKPIWTTGRPQYLYKKMAPISPADIMNLFGVDEDDEAGYRH